MFINKKIMQLIISNLLDYDMDIANKVLELKEESQFKDTLKQKQRDILQLSIYLTNRIYRPKLRRVKIRKIK